MPLLISSRETVRNELAGWFGSAYEKLEIAATYNLILNASNMVRNGIGAALCFDLDNISDALTFVPLSPRLETGRCWLGERTRRFLRAAERFLRFLKHTK